MRDKCLDSGIERRVACEKAYRRGYQQGIRAALEAHQAMLQNCITMVSNDIECNGMMHGWLQEVAAWRESIDDKGTMVKAPIFPLKVEEVSDEVG